MRTLPTGWQRSSSLQPKASDVEIWECLHGNSRLSFPVDVLYGKPLAVLELKRDITNDLPERIKRVKARCKKTFSRTPERVTECPICGECASKSQYKVSVYGGSYHECQQCFHVFVLEKRDQESLTKYYETDEDYQSTYTDKNTLDVRLETVALPKTRWVIETYKRIFGRTPSTLLDVGAGSGHMAAAAKRLGLDVDAMEVSKSGRAFSRDVFGIDLMPDNFLSSSLGKKSYDLITFWGVIEHVPYPLEMLNKARKHLTLEGGMVIAEVPRWHSLSSAIQTLHPDTVVRHLVPSEHLHIFSDSSIATSFLMSGLGPVAAWYYGMDVYETITQLSNNYKRETTTGLNNYIEHLQPLIDVHRFADFIALAGTTGSLGDLEKLLGP